MASLEKLPSGSWRAVRSYKGKRYRVTFDHKPTKSEAERQLWLLIDQEPVQDPNIINSFEDTAIQYIKSKSAILSPSTISAYYSMLKNMPESFKLKPISAITQQLIQICINDYSKGHSAKSVRNLSGFISAVIKSVNPSFVNTSTLPQKSKSDFYVPEDSDVKKILEYSKGSRYEIPLWLAVYGLRRSETCALLTTDLDKHNIITVDKALVRDVDGHWFVKTTKTVESSRKVVLSQYVADLIRELPEGRVYTHSPGQINEYMQNVQKKIGIPKFSLHKLRHFFAATAREVMGDAYVEKMGGWKPGSDVMKKVYDYTKSKQEEESKNAYAEKMAKFLN